MLPARVSFPWAPVQALAARLVPQAPQGAHRQRSRECVGRNQPLSKRLDAPPQRPPCGFEMRRQRRQARQIEAEY